MVPGYARVLNPTVTKPPETALPSLRFLQVGCLWDSDRLRHPQGTPQRDSSRAAAHSLAVANTHPTAGRVPSLFSRQSREVVRARMTRIFNLREL